MKPTQAMRKALKLAQATGELRRMKDERKGTQRQRTIKGTDGEPNPAYVEPPEWPHGIAPATLAALVRHGWLEEGTRKNRRGYDMHVWSVTDAGRLVLNPPPKQQRDTPRDGRYKGKARFRVMIGGVWTDVAAPEPEEVKPSDLDHRWSQEAEKRWRESKDRREQARKLADRMRAA